jgi:hypothetical protein
LAIINSAGRKISISRASCAWPFFTDYSEDVPKNGAVSTFLRRVVGKRNLRVDDAAFAGAVAGFAIAGDFLGRRGNAATPALPWPQEMIMTLKGPMARAPRSFQKYRFI